MDFMKIDTTVLLFNPKLPDFISKFLDYPEFLTKEWPYTFSREEFFRYVVFMYDKNSELWTKIPNFWQRKRLAAQAAGLIAIPSGARKGMFQEDVEKMLLGFYPELNRMMIRYSLFFNDVEYLTLISYLELFIQETMRVMEQNESKDTKVIIANIDSLNQKIRELTIKVFGGDDLQSCKRELYKSAINEILKIRPELIAMYLQDKDPPVSPTYEYN